MIRAEQTGIQKHQSTMLQILRSTEAIHSGYLQKDVTAVAFLDTAKDFDNV